MTRLGLGGYALGEVAVRGTVAHQGTGAVDNLLGERSVRREVEVFQCHEPHGVILVVANGLFDKTHHAVPHRIIGLLSCDFFFRGALLGHLLLGFGHGIAALHDFLHECRKSCRPGIA